ncbi:hypothetical protein G9A89_007370 [Geosiphon pyriformis]|nr:hypothetical protein G9A89_007370 [Geosiphon pyriformis]
MPCLTCGEILPNEELWNDVPGRRETCDKAYWMIIHTMTMKSGEWQAPKPKVPCLKRYEKSKITPECLNIMDLTTLQTISSWMTQMHFRTNIRNWPQLEKNKSKD